MKRLLFVLLLAASTLHAQQSVPVTIPQQMMPVPVTVNGLPAGCTWTATGGATIIVTVANCAVIPPPSTVTGVTISGPTSVATGATAMFTATVQGTNSPSQAVVWSVIAGSGSITSGGVFTAPAAVGSTTIKATSVQDATKGATASMTITSATPPSGPVVGATITVINPCPAPCHMWPGATAGGGVIGTAIPLTPGATGTIIGGPVTTGNGNVWWQLSFPGNAGNVTGWTGTGNFTVNGSQPIAVLLNWNASLSASLVGYNVYRGTAHGGPYAPLGCTVAAKKSFWSKKTKATTCTTVPATATTYLDPAVTHGTTYFYVLTALGNAAVYATPESTYSTEASVTF